MIFNMISPGNSGGGWLWNNGLDLLRNNLGI